MYIDESDNSNELFAQMIISGALSGFGRDESSDDERICVRAPYKKRSFDECDARFDKMYFSEHYSYNDRDIKRRFRMPQHVFEKVLHGISSRGLFTQLFDAVHK